MSPYCRTLVHHLRLHGCYISCYLDYETEIWLQFTHGEIRLIGSIQIFREGTCLWCSLSSSICYVILQDQPQRGQPPHGEQEEGQEKGHPRAWTSSCTMCREGFFVFTLFLPQEFEISFLNSCFETTSYGFSLSCPNKCCSFLHMSKRKHSSQNPEI